MNDIFSYGLLTQGGVLMIPIIICGVIGLAISFERYFSLRRARIDTQEFMSVFSMPSSLL